MPSKRVKPISRYCLVDAQGEIVTEDNGSGNPLLFRTKSTALRWIVAEDGERVEKVRIAAVKDGSEHKAALLATGGAK